ncbi:MAG: hypothetical protein DMG07_18485 [Acidobacteria bacterium]|nr:MAG: hypothetical protein DMG07_18485 [Acidobacteriota bacterium]
MRTASVLGFSLFCLHALLIQGGRARYRQGPSDAALSAALDTTANTYVLFLDMREVESLFNTELVVNQAEKYSGNPVLPTGDMNDFDFMRASSWAGNVIFDQDEGIFKMWYNGGRNGLNVMAVGYAWSSDGRVWHKPILGLYEFKGSKNNNICWRPPNGIIFGGSILRESCGHFTAFKDYKERDPDKRYKGWGENYHEKTKRNPYFPLYSPDGIHWTLGPTPVISPVGDIGNAFIDDHDPDLRRRIKVYGHTNSAYGPDIEHCIPNPNNPVIDGANIAGAAKDGLEDTIHLISVLHYRGYYIMLYDYNFWLDYHGYKGNVEVRKRDRRVPEPKTGFFTGDTRLAVSRDGVGKFQRVNPHQPVIARGERGQWDSGFTVTAGPIVRNDRIYIFYSGVDEVAGITEPQWTELDAPYAIRTGMASLGTVTTVPLRVTEAGKARLLINASNLLESRDWIKVELLDAATNQPIEGYGRSESDEIVQEGIRIPVHWGKNETLGGVKASAIKIRFDLYGKARLHSFHFE